MHTSFVAAGLRRKDDAITTRCRADSSKTIVPSAVMLEEDRRDGQHLDGVDDVSVIVRCEEGGC